MKRLILIIAATAILLGGCRKENPVLENPNAVNCTTYVQQFDAIWHGLDNGYVFWGRDTTDWDAAYNNLRPLFEQFDADGGATNSELQKAYEELLLPLIDHHLTVQVRNLKTGGLIYVQPGSHEVRQRPEYHNTPYDEQISALKRQEGITQLREWSGDVASCFALLPHKGSKKIAYLRISSFSLLSLQSYVGYGQYPSSALDPVRYFYGTVCDGMSPSAWANDNNVAALIIDLRGNGGGNAAELSPLFGSLAQEDVLWGYTRIKDGLGRLDYSPWAPFHIRCPENHLKEPKPIVVLVDMNSVSCSEISTQVVKLLPNGTVIGERTWGGTCPLLPGQYNLLYSGVFGDIRQYGYYVYTSNFDLVTTEYKSLEGVGVEPDIVVPFDYDALSRGIDNQLEAALSYLRAL
ncbi:MAG: hypothetical protein J6X62_02955 [Bacteroidales bacterium]|nr:hypothetical protein [Bacteroidales bacterium]